MDIFVCREFRHTNICLEHGSNILTYTTCTQFIKVGNVHSSILGVPFFSKVVLFYLELCLLKLYVEESVYRQDKF